MFPHCLADCSGALLFLLLLPPGAFDFAITYCCRHFSLQYTLCTISYLPQIPLHLLPSYTLDTFSNVYHLNLPKPPTDISHNLLHKYYHVSCFNFSRAIPWAQHGRTSFSPKHTSYISSGTTILTLVHVLETVTKTLFVKSFDFGLSS